MDEKIFGAKIVALRRGLGLSQNAFAERLGVSPQAVSKWENGRSLPETALLPAMARLLECSLDELFDQSRLVILEARYGDGLESADVARRLNRLVEGDRLDIVACGQVLGAQAGGPRVPWLLVSYQSGHGVGCAAAMEGEPLVLDADSPAGAGPAGEGLEIVGGSYGTRAHHYDVMPKIRHYSAFGWKAYHANHETFPSAVANDEPEYLSLVYINADGLHIATCGEGESLAYTRDGTMLERRAEGGEVFLPEVPLLPPFGSGMECSWAAALTAALQAMGEKTTYEEVMGVSGACYRLAFASPGWDYSSVDGLVAYDYATPGYAAFGYLPEMHSHVEKPERAAHRQRIMRELRAGMPALGINLRVAAEWGVICGYAKNGEELYCRTKYDAPTIENDPDFMKGWPPFDAEGLNRHGYLQVDNWPFLLCYFSGRQRRPSAKESFYASLGVFVNGLAHTAEGGYALGLNAYAVWAQDLRDDAFFAGCGDEQLARRFSVHQFCTLALSDARRAARAYIEGGAKLAEEGHREQCGRLAALFGQIAEKADALNRMAATDHGLDAAEVKGHWPAQARHRQAALLDELCALEQRAAQVAAAVVQ